MLIRGEDETQVARFHQAVGCEHPARVQTVSPPISTEKIGNGQPVVRHEQALGEKRAGARIDEVNVGEVRLG